MRLGPIDTAEPAARQMPQRDVLGNAEGRHEAELLVHKADTQGLCTVRRQVVHRLVAHEDAPVVGRLLPRQDLHQRGFSSAVFAEQNVDLARQQVERDVIQGPYARILLADVFQTQQRRTSVRLFDGGRPGGHWAVYPPSTLRLAPVA